jgi:hypothetical protein
MKRLLLAHSLLLSTALFAVSLNFSGNFRTEGDLYNKLDMGATGGSTDPTKTFLSARALLEPKLVIDDHFSLISQWNLLTSPGFTPNGRTPLGVGQGGYVFGDTNSSALVLSRAWMEWVSDYGVVRAGRMPFSWGYGLVWDSGSGIWDDFQTTYDRLEYRLHFGHVIGAIAYSKSFKLSVLGEENDQEFYTAFIQYDNPEEDIDAGIIFEKQVRAASQQTALMTTASPYELPTTGPDGSTINQPPLAQQTPYPLNNFVLDLYAKKVIDYFTIGGEASWLSGTAVDYNNNGVYDTLNAFAFTLNTSYDFHKLKIFADFLYASGDSNLGADHLNGFVLLNRNRRPGLILGRELLGNFNSNTVGQGSLVWYGNPGGFSGVYYLRPGLRVDWSQQWSSGIEAVIAQKAATQAGEPSNLGVEIDIGGEHEFYENFDLGLTFGYLFPGDGIFTGAGGIGGVFGVRTMASVKF